MNNAQRVSLRLARIKAYRESATTVGGHDVDWLLEQLAAANERADGLQADMESLRETNRFLNSKLRECMPRVAAPVPAQPAVVPEWLDRSSD